MVGGDGEGAALSNGIFGGGRYFRRDPFSVGGAGEVIVGLGNVYENVVVRLRVVCCIAKPGDD